MINCNWAWPWKAAEYQAKEKQWFEHAERHRERTREKETTIKEMRRRIQEAIDSKNLSTCMYILTRIMDDTAPVDMWTRLLRDSPFGGECQSIKEGARLSAQAIESLQQSREGK